MNLRLFIERPILSGVVSAIIVVLGVISYFALPVEQYPDIAPPTIRVTANYTGASAETIQKGVIVPLEEAINGVENMIYMTSEASNAGFASITVYFKQGTDPDMAAVNVQNRVQRATGQLPAEVTRVGVTVAKRQTSMLQVFALYSPMNFLANYVNITMKPEILRISGVGELNVLGNDYSMRVWLKPDIMAQYGLVPSDITRVLEEQNIEVAAGVVGENSDEMQQYTLKYKGRLLTAEEFEEIVIRSTDNGLVLKLKDVADIELGRVNYNYTSTYDGHPGVTCMVYQTPGSNATEVNEQVTAFLEKASETLPKGLAVETLRSTNEYLYASINEVVETLIIAIILVVLVIYVFLQDIRSTVIPAVSIFVSLIGTLAFIYAVGYSINLITLFALVLVIGTVVDDAIVVVEAVQERFDAGYRSSYLASIDAMKNVQSAIIVSSLVFMSVFIPVSFMGGTSGTFYTQFGLTMAVAVGISAINALTLSPALCALILRPYKDEAGNQRQNFAYRFRKAFYAVFDIMAEKYRNGVIFFMHRKWMIWSLIGLSVILLVLFVRNTKTGLVPQEDLAYVNANVSTSPGSSLYFTSQVMDSIGKRLERIPQVDHAVIISGWGMISGGSSSAGTVMLKLKPWNERTKKGEHANDVIQQIYSLTADIKDATVFATSPGMIPGYGTGNSLDLNLQDLAGGDIETFTKVVNDYTEALRKRPEIARAYSSFSLDYPQWEIELDAAKCKRAGISPDEVLATLSGYYGGLYASNFNRFSRIYRVMIQADPKYRLDTKSMENCFVRMANGEMAPLSQFLSLKRVYGAEVLERFNMYNSIGVNVMPADGYSSGDAIQAIKETAATALPIGYGYDFGGITREENQQSNNTVIIFGISLLIIYLLLAALYESLLLPFPVLLSIPAGVLGSFLFARMMGMENNIYLQIGLVMLIGLLAKTAILLTEYASDRRRAGMSLAQAAVAAARARLRPILMTVLTMVVGLLPLMFAHGVGANGNSSLGAGVIGGMIIGTLGLLFFVPVLFVAFQWLQEKIRPMRLSDMYHRELEQRNERIYNAKDEQV